MILAKRILPALPVAGLLMAGAAEAETLASANVSAEAGYGRNPFFGSLNGEDTASLIARIEPTVTLQAPTSRISLNGQLEEVTMTGGLPDLTNWSAGAGASATLSPFSSVSANANYSSRVYTGLYSAIKNAGSQPTDPNLPDTPDPTETDLAGQRLKTFSGGASFSTRFSVRDSFTASAFTSNVDYDTAINIGSGYWAYGGAVSLQHVLSESTTVGANLSYSQSDYDSDLYGKSRQISPTANVSLRLSPRTTLAASAGVSFSNIDRPSFKINQIYFTGQASLCHKGDRSNLCAAASRSVGSTAQAATSTISSAGLNYTYRLTPRSSFDLGARYSESHSITNIISGGNYRYGSAMADYALQLRERLSFAARARYTSPIKSLGAGRKSFYAGVSLSYRLGR